VNLGKFKKNYKKVDGDDKRNYAPNPQNHRVQICPGKRVTDRIERLSCEGNYVSDRIRRLSCERRKKYRRSGVGNGGGVWPGWWLAHYGWGFGFSHG